MLTIASAFLATALDAALPRAIDDAYNARPTCVCTKGSEKAVIKGEEDAALLGTTYTRIHFGPTVARDYKTAGLWRQERTKGPPFWVYVATNSKAPPDAMDAVELLIDEKTGCLLDARYSE